MKLADSVVLTQSWKKSSFVFHNFACNLKSFFMLTHNKKTCLYPQENDRTANISRLQRMFTNVRMFVLKNIRCHCSIVFDVRLLESSKKAYIQCLFSQARPVLSDLGLCISLYRHANSQYPVIIQPSSHDACLSLAASCHFRF